MNDILDTYGTDDDRPIKVWVPPGLRESIKKKHAAVKKGWKLKGEYLVRVEEKK